MADSDVRKRADRCVTRVVDGLSSMGFAIGQPDILPGPDDGSIDLHWDYPGQGYEMLINIPADPAAKAGFYVEARGKLEAGDGEG